jgi:phosphatidylethanolamine/phosphatidyl-N-methylethanolamine N-methyltransferase
VVEQQNALLRVYERHAHRYDRFWGAVLQPGRRSVIELMRLALGQRVLEVGVGTGLSLPLYPRYVRVTGIDVAAAMLDRARARCERSGLTHVEALSQMDAEAMAFPDASFDKVVAMYVASVVRNPQNLVAEMRRVCKPGGELFIVNHFRSRNPVLGGLERALAPLAKIVGFHPDFCLNTFVRDCGLEQAERFAVNFFGYWTLLRLRVNPVLPGHPPGSVPAAARR